MSCERASRGRSLPCRLAGGRSSSTPRQKPSTIIDTASFPTRLGLRMEASADASTLSFTTEDGQSLDLHDVGAVWYRRIRPLDLDPLRLAHAASARSTRCRTSPSSFSAAAARSR